MALPNPLEGQELIIFSSLAKDPVIEAFFAMLEEASWGSHAALSKSVAAFIRELYNRQCTDWSLYLRDAVLDDENCLGYYQAKDKAIPSLMLDTMGYELEFLQACSQVTLQDILPAGFHASWTTSPISLAEDYLYRLIHLARLGSGEFARHGMFRLRGDASLQAIEHPDAIDFDHLYGYQKQHEQLIENTSALMEGKAANNVLLYGAAGTGKSASIKAIANRYKDDGLRLIEVDKEHLDRLPLLLDELNQQPLKFIVFIDDLSFNAQDDRYALLKAVLEGSSAHQNENTLIYATSNRRHVVRESQSERSEDLHLFDHLQELSSLSDRFGLQILYELPSPKQYLELIDALAKEKGFDMDNTDMDDLHAQAERFALRKGNRSPRTARQFMATLKEKEHAITG